MATRDLTVEVSVKGGKTATYQLRAADEEVENLKESGTQTGEALGNALEESADAADDLGDAAESAGRRFDSLSEGASELGERLRKGDFGGAADSLKGIAKSFPVATAAVAGSTAAAVGAGAAYAGAAYQAANFESAMVEVQKTTGLADEKLSVLGEEIQSLAGRLGMGQQELAQIAATAGQLGIEGTENISAFTETVAKLTSVTELSAEEASAQIARIANAFEMPISEAENLGSVLNGLSNTTTAKAGDISNALSRVGSAGASIGLTADEVAALGATLIDTGIGAERAGTSMRNVFIRLQSEAEKLADVAGMTQEEFSSLVQDDALEALRAYLSGLEDIPEAQRAIKIKEVFGQENFQAVQSLSEQLGLMNDNLERSATLSEEGTSLNEEFGKALETVSKQWAKLKGNLLDVVTTVGQTALPALQSLLSTINRFFDPVGSLRQEFARLRGEVEAVTKRQQLLDRYNQLVANGKKGTDEFQRVVSSLSEELPDYAVKWNKAGEAVGVYADQVQTLISAQRQQARMEMMDNLQQQAERFAENKKALEQAQAEYIDAMERRAKQQQMGSYQEMQEAIERGVDPDAPIFHTLKQIRADLEEGEKKTTEFSAAVDELARSFAVWYDITSQPGTDAYRQDLAMLSEELGITHEMAGKLIDRMRTLGEGANEGGGSGGSGGGLRNVLGGLEDAADEAKTMLEKAREELARFEAKLSEVESSDDRLHLATLRRMTEQTRELVEAREAYIELLAQGLPAAQTAEEKLPGTEEGEDGTSELERNIQSAVPDALPTDQLEQLRQEVEDAREEMEGFGDDVSSTMEQVADVSAQAAGGFAQAFRTAFEASGGKIEEFWRAYQALSIAQTIASTYSAATAAISPPPVGYGPTPAGYAAAAAAVATGLANVAQIASTSPGDSGGSGGGSSGGSSGGGDAARRRPRGYAKGTDAAESGWALVGEEGPEIVNFAGGESVVTNENTQALLSAIGQTASQTARPRGGESAAAMESMREEVEALRKSVEAMEGAADTFTKRRPKARVDAREVRGGLDQVERDDNATFGKTSRGS
jgi:TP901 family phage tail tape measure protein